MISYNVFRDGQLYKENQTNREIKSLTGLSDKNVHRYLNTGKTFKIGSYEYSFTYGLDLSGHKDRVFAEPIKSQETKWDPKKVKQWNEVCEAARLINAGTHHIVSKFINGKWVKVTEAK
jgi:hypothetical protein